MEQGQLLGREVSHGAAATSVHHIPARLAGRGNRFFQGIPVPRRHRQVSLKPFVYGTGLLQAWQAGSRVIFDQHAARRV